MSQVGRQSDASAGSGSSTVQDSNVQQNGAGGESSAASSIAEEELPLQALMHPALEPANLRVEMEEDGEEDSNWNEVPSPQRGNSLEHAPSAAPTAHRAEEVTEAMDNRSQAAGSVMEAKEQQHKESVNNTTHTQAKAQTQTIQTPSASATVPAAVTKSVKTHSATAVEGVGKKPSNLVGGTQLSFLGSSSAKTAGNPSSIPAAGGKTKTVVRTMLVA